MKPQRETATWLGTDSEPRAREGLTPGQAATRRSWGPSASCSFQRRLPRRPGRVPLVFFSKAAVVVQTADVRIHPMALGGTTRDAIFIALVR